jgi:hypothetical protein
VLLHQGWDKSGAVHFRCAANTGGFNNFKAAAMVAQLTMLGLSGTVFFGVQGCGPRVGT